MSYKISVVLAFFIAQCDVHSHSVHLLKASIDHNVKPLKLIAYIHGKWTSFSEIEKERVIHKRELENVIPSTENRPAPVIEPIQEKINVEATAPFLGMQQPVPRLNRVPLTRSVESQLNTNIQDSLPVKVDTAQIQTKNVPQEIRELFGGLPPRVEPIPAEPVRVVIVTPPNPTVPPPSVETPVQEETPPPALFDRTRMRKYAVYAGDVILKYLSQFFNRARLTYNRFTSPPPPTPEFAN